MKKLRRALSLTVVILVNLFADRLAKFLVREYLPRSREVPVIGSFFVLRYAENRGAFLSLGAGLPPVLHLILLKIFPFLVITGLFLYTVLHPDDDRRQFIALGCIIGGGLGNLIDRVFAGGMVTDFLLFRLGPFRTGILNLADLSVTVGCVILFLTFMPRKKISPPSAGDDT